MARERLTSRYPPCLFPSNPPLPRFWQLELPGDKPPAASHFPAGKVFFTTGVEKPLTRSTVNSLTPGLLSLAAVHAFPVTIVNHAFSYCGAAGARLFERDFMSSVNVETEQPILPPATLPAAGAVEAEGLLATIIREIQLTGRPVSHKLILALLLERLETEHDPHKQDCYREALNSFMHANVMDDI